jgi:hypothetical protein
MTTTTIWNIAQMERHTADGIVFTVHYTVAAADGTYSSSAYGSIGLEAPEDNIIPYADLTPEIVIGWVQDKLHNRASSHGVPVSPCFLDRTGCYQRGNWHVAVEVQQRRSTGTASTVCT